MHFQKKHNSAKLLSQHLLFITISNSTLGKKAENVYCTLHSSSYRNHTMQCWITCLGTTPQPPSPILGLLLMPNKWLSAMSSSKGFCVGLLHWHVRSRPWMASDRKVTGTWTVSFEKLYKVKYNRTELSLEFWSLELRRHSPVSRTHLLKLQGLPCRSGLNWPVLWKATHQSLQFWIGAHNGLA